MNTQKSDSIYNEAVTVMPGGVNSPVRAYRNVGRNPLFIEKGKGSKIYDIDGNEYIDYICSWGPNILGHCYPKVIEEVKKACDNGLTFGAPTEKEVVLAELIREIMPSMEVLRMVNSGTEAVMSAIRVARGFTKRDMILKFKGCYHGHSDGLLVKAGSAALTAAVPDSLGVPKSYTENTLVALYNDEKSVEELFEKYGNKIACVVVEPVAANMGVVLPKKGFLQFLRDITEKYGSLLIFDEVITGFRLSLGGAQEYFGIKPDMTTLGKIVGFCADFNFKPLQYGVSPFCFYLLPKKIQQENYWHLPHVVYVRMTPGADIAAVTAHIRRCIAEVDPRTEPGDIVVRVFDEELGLEYDNERKLTAIVGLFALLAVVIALMGVFGLVLFETQHRRREIAVRRVMGASRGEILAMFNRRYVMLVAVCFVLAVPVSIWAVRHWLAGFAYAVPLYWWVFALALAGVLAVTALTVTVRSWRAVNENPAESVKSE